MRCVPSLTCQLTLAPPPHTHAAHPTHTPGSQTLMGEAVAFETEATAILDTIGYIRPDVYTLVGSVCVGGGGACVEAARSTPARSLTQLPFHPPPPRR